MVTKQFQNITLSRLGMGNMRLPILPGGKDGDIDYEKAGQILDYAMENGINYFDSAYVYHSGQSERFVGQALRRYPRDSYYITTTFGPIRTTGRPLPSSWSGMGWTASIFTSFTPWGTAILKIICITAAFRSSSR